MGSTYTSLHFHIVFSTKGRRGLIAPAWRPRLHEYLGGTVRGLGGVAESVGGIEDHVHILASLSASHRLADFLRELKKASSAWCAENHERSFAWQEGYAAFSVSPTHRDAVRRYIAGQEAHHRQVGFVAEITRLLERNGVRYDPKYLL
jgi:REP element-mobilizing transposase RayT